MHFMGNANKFPCEPRPAPIVRFYHIQETRGVPNLLISFAHQDNLGKGTSFDGQVRYLGLLVRSRGERSHFGSICRSSNANLGTVDRAQGHQRTLLVGVRRTGLKLCDIALDLLRRSPGCHELIDHAQLENTRQTSDPGTALHVKNNRADKKVLKSRTTEFHVPLDSHNTNIVLLASRQRSLAP